MFTQLSQRYGAPLLAFLQRATESIEPRELATMLRYALGWVDAQATPVQGFGGKRLRPHLLLLCNEAAGGNWQEALSAAAAIELLHNFSLVHDDIQDDSATRHQRPSVWATWDRARAINAGDSLLGLAHSTLLQLRNVHPPTRVLRCWEILNDALRELTRGQHLDLSLEKATTLNESSYQSMIAGKTVALLAAAAQMGALLADSIQEEHYRQFGRELGFAFQIHDDILGIWGNSTITGKPNNDDLRQKKKTLPIIHGLQREAELRSIFAQPQLGAGDIARARNILERCDARALAEAAAAQHSQSALAMLERAQPQGEAGTLLRALPSTLLQRRS